MTKSIEASLSRYQLSEFDSAWGAVQRGIEKRSPNQVRTLEIGITHDTLLKGDSFQILT